MIRSAGHLNPGDAELAFDRFDLGGEFGNLVRHVWVGRWDVPEGEARPQRVLTYPAFNAIVTPEEAALHGPELGVSVRQLRLRSWVVGVLFCPGAAHVLTSTPAKQLVGTSEALTGAPVERLRLVMERNGSRDELTALLRKWLAPVAERLDPLCLLANEAGRLAEEDPSVTTVAGLAARVGAAPRTLARTVKQHTGLTPHKLIERRRLQTAATTLFLDPDTNLAELSTRLGYADQAHFTRRYRAVLAETPASTRRAGQLRKS